MEENQKLEKHFRFNDIDPVKRFTYRDFDVYICEGGPYFDKRKPEYPYGWYESAYALGKDGKPIFYQPIEFEMTHDLDQSDTARKEGRINAAIKAAKNHIDNFYEIEDGERLH